MKEINSETYQSNYKVVDDAEWKFYNDIAKYRNVLIKSILEHTDKDDYVEFYVPCVVDCEYGFDKKTFVGIKVVGGEMVYAVDEDGELVSLRTTYIFLVMEIYYCFNDVLFRNVMGNKNKML